MCLVKGLCLGLGSLGHKRIAKALIPLDVYLAKLTTKHTVLKELKKHSKETKANTPGRLWLSGQNV